MKRQTILKQTAQYYTRMIAAHGPSPLGVAWSSSEVQELRFRQLLKVASDCRDCSFNDYGCGYGALIRLMRAWRDLPKQYCAFTGTRSMFQHTLDRADR